MTKPAFEAGVWRPRLYEIKWYEMVLKLNDSEHIQILGNEIGATFCRHLLQPCRWWSVGEIHPVSNVANHHYEVWSQIGQIDQHLGNWGGRANPTSHKGFANPSLGEHNLDLPLRDSRIWWGPRGVVADKSVLDQSCWWHGWTLLMCRSEVLPWARNPSICRS
jgi:hypothetical protein